MPSKIHCTKWLWLILALPFVQACGHTPVTLTAWEAFGPGLDVAAVRLNPDLNYLRVTLNGRSALMVLGYVDGTSDGDIETWYGSEGNVIRLKNGRIFSTKGLEVDWRAVRYSPLPSWSDALQHAAEKPLTYERERDVMPGYRFGIRDTLSLNAAPAPTDSGLAGLPAEDLTWFEERTVGSSNDRLPAKFAVQQRNGTATVIYSEACLAPHYCFSWQYWPATE